MGVSLSLLQQASCSYHPGAFVSTAHTADSALWQHVTTQGACLHLCAVCGVVCRVHQPLRQCLGWALLHAGRLEEAAAVYKQVGEQNRQLQYAKQDSSSPSEAVTACGHDRTAMARG